MLEPTLLIDADYFLYRAAQAASTLSTTGTSPNFSDSPLLRKPKGRKMSTQDVEKIRNSLRCLMWSKVGLVRTGNSLKKTVDQIQQWSQKLSAAPWNRPGLETRNMVLVGQCIAESALWRANSVGAHFREDFPFYKGLAWKRHSQIPAESAASIKKKTRKPVRN